MLKLFKSSQPIGTAWKTTVALLLAGSAAYAQLSSSAYRVLGQPGFQQNGMNMEIGRAHV